MRKTTILGFSGLLALLFLTALTAAGCNRSPNFLMGYETTSGGVATNLTVANPRLQRKIAILEADSRRVGDILHVKVQLANRTKRTRKFEYKFLWYDKDGFETSNTRGTWTPAMIDGLEGMAVQEVAPSPEAASFKLQLRFPDPVSE